MRLISPIRIAGNLMRNVKISTRLYCLVGFTLAVLAATMVSI